MGKCKTANILEMDSHRPKGSEIWDSGGSLGSICATSGTLPNGQVSCPNMAILKIGLYLGSHYPYSKIKLNFDPLGYKEGICATS